MTGGHHPTPAPHISATLRGPPGQVQGQVPSGIQQDHQRRQQQQLMMQQQYALQHQQQQQLLMQQQVHPHYLSALLTECHTFVQQSQVFAALV